MDLFVRSKPTALLFLRKILSLSTTENGLNPLHSKNTEVTPRMVGISTGGHPSTSYVLRGSTRLYLQEHISSCNIQNFCNNVLKLILFSYYFCNNVRKNFIFPMNEYGEQIELKLKPLL